MPINSRKMKKCEKVIFSEDFHLKIIWKSIFNFEYNEGKVQNN